MRVELVGVVVVVLVVVVVVVDLIHIGAANCSCQIFGGL